MPDARFSCIAERAQRMDGFAQTLEPVATAGRFKIMQSIADNVVYISQNGGAWTPLNGGGGGGTTLDDAYQAGSTIDITDLIGPVNLVTSAVTTAGGALLITAAPGMTLAAPFVAQTIDMGGAAPGANALTGLSITMATPTPSTSTIIGLEVIGAPSTQPKFVGAASAKYGLVSIRGRAQQTPLVTVTARNTSMKAGSGIFFGWDNVDFGGVTQTTVLDDQTHMLTLDGQTNVNANSQEFVNLNILHPATSSLNSAAIKIASTSKAGYGYYYTHAGSLTGTYNGIFVDLSTMTDNGQLVSGVSCALPACYNVNNFGFELSSAQRAGRGFWGLFNGSLLNTLTLMDLDASGVTAGGTGVRGILVSIPASSNASTTAIQATSAQTSGNIVSIVGSGTLDGTLAMVSIIASGVAPGAQRINGVDVTLPATSSASTTGFNVTGVMTAGRYLNGSLTASLTGTFVGCEIDCATGVTSNNFAIIGGRFQVAATSHALAAGLVVISAQTASSCIYVNANGATGAPNGVKVTMATTISKSGQDGSAFFAAIPGAAACGLAVYPTLDGAFGQNAIQVRREAAVTQSFTESTALIEFINTCTFSAGTQTFSQPQVNCGIFSTVSGATHTWSGKILQVIQSVTENSGALTLSGRILSVEHSPTRNGGTLTDTTTGMAIVMTPTAASGAVVGQATVMQSNTSSSGCAAQFTWNSAAGTNGVTNNGIVNIYTGGNQSSGALTFLSIYSKTTNLTINGTVYGINCDLTNNIAAATASAIVGHQILISNSSNASTVGMYISSTQTGAGSAGIILTMNPASGSGVIGMSIAMSSASATGAAITIAHSGTNANQIVFTSAADGTGAHLSGPTGSTFLIRAGARTNSGTGRDIQVKGGAGNTGTDAGGNVLLSGGTPVSTGATGGVIATSMLAETSVSLGNATGSPFNVDCSLGNSFTATTTGSTTWAFINPPASGYVYSFMLTLTNGGSQTQIWPASVKWPGGVAPALTVSGVDVLVFTTIDNGTTWRGVLSQSDSK